MTDALAHGWCTQIDGAVDARRKGKQPVCCVLCAVFLRVTARIMSEVLLRPFCSGDGNRKG